MVVLESMKMEHVVRSPVAGVVRSLAVEVGALVAVGRAAGRGRGRTGRPATGAEGRSDDADLDRRSAPTWPSCSAASDGRSTPAAPRWWSGATARVGGRPGRTSTTSATRAASPSTASLAIAAQRGRRPLEELIERTPADGLVAGIGRVNGDRFDDERARCAVLSYDYTVLAGTQGQQNHRKKDRLFELVERLRLPVVLFAEGGGGRPGDTDYAVITGLDTLAFALFGALSGLVPLVGIASGWCFAGNAALLGCCDVIIATPGTSIGMGGPAMIEGGGLGTYRPEEIGPLDVQVANGVVDVVAEDEADAVRLARRYLVLLPGARPTGGRAPTSACCARPSPRSGCGSTTSAARRHPGRHRLGAGAPPGLRAGHGHRPGPDGGPPGRRGGQQSRPPRRGHRPGRRRQGGPVPPAVRRPRPAGAVPVRHPGVHGRAPRPRRRPRSATSAGSS